MAGVEDKLAVLYADLSGSVRLSERLGEREAMHAVERCIKRMERAVAGYRGRLLKLEGDRLAAAFGAAEDAFQAAVEMQQRVSDLPPVSGVKLAIRVGFHCGAASGDGADVSGEAVDIASRLAGLAESEQILASSQAVDRLPRPLRESTHARAAGDEPVFEVTWRQGEELVAKASTGAAPRPTAARLCVRYRGRAYLLDEKTPFLALGRDPLNDLVIDDRKASRHHARIERRGDGFVYVDQSTNGSYLAIAGTPEILLRRDEIALHASGSICFGCSANDPQSDCASFEYF